MYSSVVLFLIGCSHPEETFVDLMEIDNDYLKDAITDFEKEFENVGMNAEGEIYGYHPYVEERFVFKPTNDGSYSYHSWPQVFYQNNVLKDEGKRIFTYKIEEINSSWDNTFSLYESNDFGENFEFVYEIPNFDTDILDDDIIFQYDKNNIFCVKESWNSGPQLWKITDANFSLQGSVDHAKVDVQKLVFTDEKIGYMIVKEWKYYYLHKTLDGGKTWDDGNLLPLESNSSNNIEFLVKDNNIIVIKKGNQLYNTNNGGISWESASLNGLTESLGFHISFVDGLLYTSTFYGNASDENVFVAGSHGYIYKSVDYGDNWIKITPELIYLDDLDFGKEEFGVVNTQSVMQYTNDGGVSWNYLTYPPIPFYRPE